MSRGKNKTKRKMRKMERIDLSLHCPISMGVVIKQAPTGIIYYNDTGEKTIPYAEGAIVEVVEMDEFGCFCVEEDDKVVEMLNTNVLNDAGFVVVHAQGNNREGWIYLNSLDKDDNGGYILAYPACFVSNDNVDFSGQEDGAEPEKTIQN